MRLPWEWDPGCRPPARSSERNHRGLRDAELSTQGAAKPNPPLEQTGRAFRSKSGAVGPARPAAQLRVRRLRPGHRKGHGKAMRATFECREALRWANRLAYDLGHGQVGLPHLLDGLVMVQGGHAANILKHLLGDTGPVRSELWALLPGGPHESGHPAEVPALPQTGDFKRVVEEALGLAEVAGANRLTSGHLLAALCGRAGDATAEIVRRRGLTSEVVRDHSWLPWEA
jgi:hypothetical protein